MKALGNLGTFTLKESCDKFLFFCRIFSVAFKYFLKFNTILLEAFYYEYSTVSIYMTEPLLILIMYTFT